MILLFEGKSSLFNIYHEVMQDRKASSGGFRIRLTYSHPKASNGNDNSIKRNQNGCKMTKIGKLIEPLLSTCHYSSV